MNLDLLRVLEAHGVTMTLHSPGSPGAAPFSAIRDSVSVPGDHWLVMLQGRAVPVDRPKDSEPQEWTARIWMSSEFLADRASTGYLAERIREVITTPIGDLRPTEEDDHGSP